MRRSLRGVLCCCLWLACHGAPAVDRLVGTTGAFSVALAAAQPGDTISLIPGVYGGGHYRAGLTDVVIRKQPGSTGEAILRGGLNGIQLSDATGVTITGLTFEQQTGNGLNIDDGGTFATPSTDITLTDLTVRDMRNGGGQPATGNNDGIKLSGVTGFFIDRVRVFDWGAGGSAVDPVGSHHGVIQNSHFRHGASTGGSGVRPKGGSKDIAIRANLIELPSGAGRAIQAGGSTGAEFFRFIDGDSGYEAADIEAYGNRVVGGSSAFSWVNIDGGVFRYNDVRQPSGWAMRVLNENPGAAIVDTQNGVFSDNTVEFSDAWSRAVNVGPETDAASFTFGRNRWLNVDDPTPGGSTPSLPATEVDGEYGVAAPFNSSQPMRWASSWGEAIVPVDAGGVVLPIDAHEELLVAVAGEASPFEPLADDPFTGDWSFVPAPENVLTADFTPILLVKPSACVLCQTGAGDYDRSGVVDAADYDLWQSQYGYAGEALADGNGDGLVDAADYTVWRDALAAAMSLEASPTAVPEPAGGAIAALAALAASGSRSVWRRRPRVVTLGR